MDAANAGRRARLSAFIVLLLLLTAQTAIVDVAQAQALPGRVISGYVYDMDGIPVAGALVTASTLGRKNTVDVQVTNTTTTNEAGYYVVLLFYTVTSRTLSMRGEYGGKTGYNNVTLPAVPPYSMTVNITISTLDTTPPSSVPNFSAQPVQGTANVSLAWAAATDNIGVEYYVIGRSLDNATWGTVATVPHPNLAYMDSPGSTNTKYYYRIRARDAQGNIGPFSYASATTDDALPPRITHVAVSVWDEGVPLPIDAVVEDHTLSAVHLWYTFGGMSTNVTMSQGLANQWNHTIPALNPGNLRYSINASDGNSWSSSGIKDVEIRDITPPSQVSNFSAQNEQGTINITLTWEAATDNVGVTRYIISRSLDNITWENVASILHPTLAYTDSEGEAHTTYNYRILAQDAALNHGPPSYANATSDDVEPPRITHNPVETWDEGVELILEAVIVDASPVSAYVWYSMGSENFTENMVQGSGDNWTYTISAAAIKPGNISYRIMANDGIYWRMTRTYEVVVIDITPPSEVLNFIAQPIPGIADVGITWVPATDNVGINRYVLQRSLDGTNWSALANVSGSATSFQDSSTNPETLYHYRIWAEDEARNAGVKSYSSTATDDAQPPRITHSPESMFDEGTAIHLQANIIDSSPIAAHLWYESGASNQTLPLLLSNDTWQTSIPAIHVVVGTIRYRISATDGLFWSNTPEYEIMVLDVTPPTAVPGFTATPEDGAANITLDWLPAWDNVRVEKYVLIRSTDGQNWTQLAELDRDIRSYNDAGLEENTTYHYSILAVDARNNNGLEAYVEATTWTAPPEQPIDDDGTGTVNETTPPRPLGLMDIALFMPIPILLLLLLLLLVRKRPKPREEKKEMEEESIERENSHPEETENASGEAGTSKN